jgi:hypothetical protein
MEPNQAQPSLPLGRLHPIGTQLNPMTQLAADQQLTLQAFQAAVDTYNQRQMALPEAILRGSN